MMLTPKSRVWRISKRRKKRDRKKRKLIRTRISNANTVQVDRLSQVKYRCVDLRRAKSSIFKKSSKYSLRSHNQNREWGASLKARELTREKKVAMGENLSPKHCPNR